MASARYILHKRTNRLRPLRERAAPRRTRKTVARYVAEDDSKPAKPDHRLGSPCPNVLAWGAEVLTTEAETGNSLGA